MYHSFSDLHSSFAITAGFMEYSSFSHKESPSATQWVWAISFESLINLLFESQKLRNSNLQPVIDFMLDFWTYDLFLYNKRTI